MVYESLSAIYLFDIHLCFILIFTINATINIHIEYIKCNDAFISSEEWVLKVELLTQGVCVCMLNYMYIIIYIILNF